MVRRTLCSAAAAGSNIRHGARPALLLEKEPTNLQAQSLGQLIERGAARGMCLIAFQLPKLTLVRF